MSNRIRHCGVFALMLACLSVGGRVVAAEAFQPVGRWVLVNDWGGAFELVLFDVKENGDRLEIETVDARPNWGTLKLQDFQCNGGHLSFVFRERSGEIRFEGDFKDAGPYAGELLGTVERGPYLDPARLVRADADKLKSNRSEPFAGYRELLQTVSKTKGLSERAALFAEAVRKAPGPATNYELRLWLIAAENVGASERQVRERLQPWFAAAEPYGPAFVAEAHLVVLRSLRSQPKFAQLSLEIAERARENLSDFRSSEDQSSLLHFLAGAAKLAGKHELAADAEWAANRIDARLDADYEASVPPFAVEPYAARKDSKDSEGHRAVLLELFTSAMCPPCLAADVAFDAIDSAFPASDVVLMQCHVRKQGADPLENPGTLARAEYYGCRGVPTAFFNGEKCLSGGGPVELAEERYREYRRLIESKLAGKRFATVRLNVTRSADKLSIRATADASEATADREPDDDRDKQPKTDLRLRLALTENLVRYHGVNGARLNHHVVRDFPGGLEGKRLVDGSAEVRLELDLEQVRRDLIDYRQQQAQFFSLACPRPLPPLELEQLAIVAFVQDEGGKRVLHAVQAAVPDR